MMDIKSVSSRFCVTTQVAPDDLAAVAAAGFSTLICHRPDGEGEDQPAAEALKSAAQEHGIAFHYIPITPGQFDAEKVEEFQALRRTCEGRVLGFCKTGARAVTIDALANPDDLSADDRIAAAKSAGYDISGALST